MPIIHIIPTPRVLLVPALLLCFSGCQSSSSTPPLAANNQPDYARPLPPGRAALRLITNPADLPDLATPFAQRDIFLTNALEASIHWFYAPSSRRHFPFEGVTHGRALASLMAMRDLLATATDERQFSDDIRHRFDIYESVGCDDRGAVLFTGYYAPVFPASFSRTRRFTAPLYRRPADLATHPVSGEPLGRMLSDGSLGPYPTRAEIDSSRMFAGNELVWLENKLDAYLIHINGSAKLKMTDGDTLHIGYAGKTDRPYHGLGQSMLEAGLLTADTISLPAIRRAYRENPEQIENLILKNENFVFFTEYNGGNWPAGSLGVKVTPETTLATDKKIYPRGGLVLVDTETITYSGGRRAFSRFMLDQDTGGAIKAPGRADIFMGIGPGAEILAGGQYAEGRLYYFFLKPEFVREYSTVAQVRP